MKTLAAAAAAALVGACAPHASRATSTSAPAGPAAVAVDGDGARKLIASGAVVIDVRTPAEFASGHVPGARNIPHDEIEKRLAEVGPADAPVVLYCRSGRRSGIAAQALREKGYLKLYDLKTFDAWLQSEPRPATAAQ